MAFAIQWCQSAMILKTRKVNSRQAWLTLRILHGHLRGSFKEHLFKMESLGMGFIVIALAPRSARAVAWYVWGLRERESWQSSEASTFNKRWRRWLDSPSPLFRQCTIFLASVDRATRCRSWTHQAATFRVYSIYAFPSLSFYVKRQVVLVFLSIERSTKRQKSSSDRRSNWILSLMPLPLLLLLLYINLFLRCLHAS